MPVQARSAESRDEIAELANKRRDVAEVSRSRSGLKASTRCVPLEINAHVTRHGDNNSDKSSRCFPFIDARLPSN